MTGLVKFPLQYCRVTSHGREVIKPIPKLQGWQNLKTSVPIDVKSGQGVGALTGLASGITVIDFDDERIHKTVIDRHQIFRETPRQRTPNGYHYFFKYDDIYPTRSFKQTPFEGMDIRNNGGCVILEDHNYQECVETGKRVYYKFLDEGKRMQELPLEFYQELSEFISTSTYTNDNGEVKVYEDPIEGLRYSIRNIEPIEEALREIDPIGNDWRLATNCLKGLYLRSNLKEIKDLWDGWSQMVPKYYSRRQNLSIWDATKPKIHPNWLFKKAGLAHRIADITYRDLDIRFDHIGSDRYVHGGLIDFKMMEPLPPDAIEYTIGYDFTKREEMRLLCERVRNSDFAIKSGTGTGKTTFTSRYVGDYCFADKVVNITMRCSLAHQHIKSFEGLGFKHYRDNVNLAAHMNKVNAKVIVQINSLRKLGEVKDAVIILDEASALMRYLANGNITALEQVYQSFVRLIKSAKQVILIDGDLDETTLKFLTEIREKEFFRILNTYQSAKGVEAVIYKNSETFTKVMEETVKLGKMTAVFGDTRTRIGVCEELYKSWGSEIKTYTTMSNTDKREIKDVNRFWRGHHIGCSPTVTTGVDYTADARVVFLICSAKSTGRFTTINPKDMGQQISRIRKIDRLHVLINSVDTKTEFKSVEEYTKAVLDGINLSNETLSPLVVKMTDTEVELNDTAFCRLKMGLGYTNSCFQDNQEFWINEILDSKGFNITYDDTGELKASYGCIHPVILKTLQDLESCLGEKDDDEQGTYLHSTIKKRLEHYRLLDNVGEIITDPELVKMIECNTSMVAWNNWCDLTTTEINVPFFNIYNPNLRSQQIHHIRLYLKRLGIGTDLSRFEETDILFGDNVINEIEERHFKKMFSIKNKKSFSTNRIQFVEQMAMTVRDLIQPCVKTANEKIIQISTTSKRVRHDGHQSYYRPIVIEHTEKIDLYEKLRGLIREKIECLLDDEIDTEW